MDTLDYDRLRGDGLSDRFSKIMMRNVSSLKDLSWLPYEIA
jgi:hypothetical protein